jgi:hypothetical protein
VVTLSLMILLTVIAVGLLTLSSITLRESGRGDAMATARSNARLALMLALGDLQKNAGPDQRVTARADVVNETIANPRLTGVWKSWEIKATSPPAPADFEKPERDRKFLGWLASSPNGIAAGQVDFANTPPVFPVTLWGKGSLGTAATDKDLVKATKVPTSPARGALAWAVMDEGVKARINTPYADNASSIGQKTAQLGAGERPGVEFIAGLNGLERKFFEAGATEATTLAKGITRQNYSLAAQQLAGNTIPDALKSLAHDVTTVSSGIFTDTASGGLKQDFHLLTNQAALPAEYKGTGVYKSRLNLPEVDAPSDPRWESLHEFARLYRETSKLTNYRGAPLLKAQAPRGWAAATVAGNPSVTTVNRKPPPGVLLLPTIAKVQMLISLIGRDLYRNLPDPVTGPLTAAQKANGMHGPQDGYFRNSRYDYDLHLLYTPIVTLHNPYNVALEFNSLKIEFVHVPFAMKVYRSGQAQTAGLIPLEQMTADNDAGQKGKTFVLNLKTKSNSRPGSPIFQLMPGEVKMFSPYIDPNLNYLDRGSYWDIYLGSSKTSNMDAMPGWPGDGVGFDCDWLAGNQLVNQEHSQGHWGGCIGIAWDDRIHVEFAPLSLPISRNKFVINMSATLATTNSPTIVSSIEMDYQRPNGLQESIAGTGVRMPMRYPKIDAVPNYVTGLQLVDRCETRIKDIKRSKAFALISIQAKSTSGGRDASQIDGRLATKPWAFAHANIGASTQRVIAEHPAHFSHEFDLQQLPGSPDDWINSDPQDRTNFISGHTGTNGTKFGIQYEIPLAPIQSLASLNGANPGGSSGYLPRFAQPIGNSWAHPLISSDKLLDTRVGGNFLDHSFLLNLALYDKFYFSGLADQTGGFGTGITTAKLAEDFAKTSRLDDPRLILHRPDGKPAAALATEVALPDAYAKVAAWQMMTGAFNINSTSVPAWKAMLASIHDANALVNELNTVSGTSSLRDLPSTTPGKETRISRFRLPASKSAADGATNLKNAYWMGPREYSDAELQTLAENIVKQVRLRGPFLSLAEFVNRRLGPASDPMSQRGALQQAIDDSDLNSALANDVDAGFEITADKVANYKYANPAAATGRSNQGAPGYLTQADLLNVLGNAATARSDTFTIRGYGEAHDAAGKMIANATCEAVVQRFPDWIDPADAAETAPAALTSKANQNFGRRFLVTSFRWLNTNEI